MMNLLYRTCVITFILYDYVIGSSDDDVNGNIIAVSSEKGEGIYVIDGDTKSDTDTAVDDSDTNDNTKHDVFDVERATTHQWQKGIVPYLIDTNIYDNIIVDRIRRAMDRIESVSCLLFNRLHSVPAPSDYGINWLHITNPTKQRDCVHSVKQFQNSSGDVGPPRMILGFDCMRETEITHSLLHMLGFNDEVQHPQRDLYVRIQWDNIQPKYRSLFTIRNVPTPYHTLTEYDTQSIMHFHDRAYSINGGATIASLIPGLLIDPSDKLSLLDKMKLRLAFGHECNKRKVDNLLMSCKNSLLEEGNVNNAAADGGIDGVIASGDDSDRGTASGSDGGVASGGDGGSASGGDGGSASGGDGGSASGGDGGSASGGDGGSASGGDGGSASGGDGGSASGSDGGVASGGDGGSASGGDGGSASGGDAGGAKVIASGSDKSTATTPERLFFPIRTTKLHTYPTRMLDYFEIYQKNINLK